jgi:hypothetical protein
MAFPFGVTCSTIVCPAAVDGADRRRVGRLGGVRLLAGLVGPRLLTLGCALLLGALGLRCTFLLGSHAARR